MAIIEEASMAHHKEEWEWLCKKCESVNKGTAFCATKGCGQPRGYHPPSFPIHPPPPPVDPRPRIDNFTDLGMIRQCGQG